MPSFEWDACFVTGEIEIDTQHRVLVDLINSLSDVLFRGEEVPIEEVHASLDALGSYAVRHFTDEEALATGVGIDSRTIVAHHGLHEAFIAEVGRMRTELCGGGAAARPVLAFLVRWLAHHILGVDQSLVREMGRVRSGGSAAEAREAEIGSTRLTSEPLVHALSELFSMLSTRNADLADANARLEARILERTAALAEANTRLERLALTDALTGLPNRRAALAASEALWERGIELSAVMVDADHFKWVNDTFGHQAGDDVLRTLARTLQGSVRTDDFVARLGGDEFLFLLPHTVGAPAVHVAESVLAAVNELAVRVGDGVWKGSVSMGLASRTPGMAGVADLLRAADIAVYEAKRRGRGCVATFLHAGLAA